MKASEEIPYEPDGSTLLLTWEEKTSGGIILSPNMIPDELVVAKVGPDVKRYNRPGMMVVYSGQSALALNIEGTHYLQVYENGIKGEITKSGAVNSSMSAAASAADPMAGYKN